MELQKKQAENDFSKGSVSRNILSLALPMTVAQLINILYNLVDRMYIGRIPGGAHRPDRAGTVPAHHLHPDGLCKSLRHGRRAPVLHPPGKGEHEEAEAILGNSFALLLLFGGA